MAALEIYNKRMLQLMDYCVKNNLVKSKKDFLISIGFTNTNNLNKVYTGMSFTIEQISMARKKYKLDAEYFFQEKYPPMFKVDNKKKPIALLKEAVALIELEMKGEKKLSRK